MKHIRKFNEHNNPINENKGYSEARKLIDHLRSKVYRKLSDDELDEFKIEMADHLGLELPNYLK
tara:strand:+ start:1087 stop:1278 length:192 start_codon:yes stop_codon:yes gene_type:complete